jgi:two-component system, sporulation sensor kinase D
MLITTKGKVLLNYKRSLTSVLKKILIYFIVTVIPSIAISFSFAKQQVQDFENDNKRTAESYAVFHSRNIENFIGETVGRLEMLATVINVQHNNLNDIEKILQDTHKKDPRFSGFYWVNPDGDLIGSSNPLSSQISVSDRDYFQRALKTGKTSISEAHIGRVTGRFIITIATPLVENSKVKGVLLSSLRIDEIENTIRNVLKDEIIILSDANAQTLINTSSTTNKVNSIEESIELDFLPWTITARIIPEDAQVFQHSFFLNLIITFTITNIIFLLILYFLLRLKIKNENEQNEKQKLELIGNLAASTAHEIRNPLTGIKGLVKLISEEYPDRKTKFYFEVIQKEIERINAIVSELLVLGKPSAYQLKSYNANDILKEIEPIIHSEANYMNVQLIIHYFTEDLPISCVKDHLKQVILNLSKNSLHAMPTGGKLTISLEKRFDSCIIIVEDNGVGIAKEKLDQVFNPFFTMKKDGSGLGLTVCKRIIDTYEGNIIIKSTLQRGTKVEITLPLSLEETE